MKQREIDPGMRAFLRAVWDGTGVLAVLIFFAWILSEC